MSLIFFLDVDGETRVSLDTESSITINMPATVSSTSNMEGQTVSDELIEGNITIDVTGRVTYSKLPSQFNNLNPIDFQNALQRARRGRRRFTLFYKDTGQALLQNYKNCVLKSATVNIGKYSDTITVSLSFEQIFISASAKKTTLKPIVKTSAKPTVTETKDSGQSTSTKVEEVDNKGMLKSILDYALGESK